MADTILKYYYPDGSITVLEDTTTEYRLRLDDIDTETCRVGEVNGKELPGIRLQVFNLDTMENEKARDAYTDPETGAPPVFCNARYTHYILNEDLAEHPEISFKGDMVIDWLGDQLIAVQLIDGYLKEYGIKLTNDRVYDLGTLCLAVAAKEYSRLEEQRRLGRIEDDSEANERKACEWAAKVLMLKQSSVHEYINHYNDVAASKQKAGSEEDEEDPFS